MFKEPPPGPLAMIMMTTHSLTHVGQEIMGDPLETKIFFATGAVCFFQFRGFLEFQFRKSRGFQKSIYASGVAFLYIYIKTEFRA
jgi:hypothetical protein